MNYASQWSKVFLPELFFNVYAKIHNPEKNPEGPTLPQKTKSIPQPNNPHPQTTIKEQKLEQI